MAEGKEFAVKKLKCEFCRTLSDNPVLGDIVTSNGMNVHENCLYTASGLVQRADPEKLSILEKSRYINGFDPEEVKSELKRGTRLRCRYCGIPGACVGCINPQCRASFHLPCIFDAKGFTVFRGAFDAFCSKHRPCQDLKSRLLEYKDEPPDCCICLFGVIPEDDLPDEKQCDGDVISRPESVISPPPSNRRKSVTIDNQQICPVLTPARKKGRRCNSMWEVNVSAAPKFTKPSVRTPHRLSAWQRHLFRPTPVNPKTPRRDAGCGGHGYGGASFTAFESWSHGVIHGGCCRLAWMHRSCAAGYAKSAGLHHAKCPLCFDRDTFISTLQKFGVWIPDRDAAWELEPGAFAYPEDPPNNTNSSSSDDDDDDNDTVNELEFVHSEGEVISVSNASSSCCQIVEEDDSGDEHNYPTSVDVITAASNDTFSPPHRRRRVRKRLTLRRRTPGATAVRRRRRTTTTSTKTMTPQHDLSVVFESSSFTDDRNSSALTEDKENKRPSLTDVLKFPSPQDTGVKLVPVRRHRKRAHTQLVDGHLKQTFLSKFFQPIDVDGDDRIMRTNELFRSMLVGGGGGSGGGACACPRASLRYGLRSNPSGSDSML